MIIPALTTALITPFKKGSLDTTGLVQNIEKQLLAGVKGLLFLGTTAETPTLSFEEQSQILEVGLQAASQTHNMVGTGLNCTKMTIEKTLFAQSKGASSALVITPYYNNPTQQGIFKHFEKIAQNTSIPLVLYNHPGRSGQNISIQTLKKLAIIPNIVGIKDASGSLSYIQNLLFELPRLRSDFQVLSGDDFNLLSYMSLGAHGLVSVASNLIPSRIREWVDTLLEGDYAKGLNIHQNLFELLVALSIESNPIPIKTAMQLCQQPAGKLRAPLFEMEPHHLQHLQKILNNMELLRGQAQPQHH